VAYVTKHISYMRAAMRQILEANPAHAALIRNANRPPNYDDPSRLEELISQCPLGEKDRQAVKRRGVVWARKQSVLVWAILEAAGGRMDATELSERIQKHRQMTRESAMATRSAGLKTLEVLGYVEVDRVANRLKEVRLLPVLNTKRSQGASS